MGRHNKERLPVLNEDDQIIGWAQNPSQAINSYLRWCRKEYGDAYIETIQAVTPNFVRMPVDSGVAAEAFAPVHY